MRAILILLLIYSHFIEVRAEAQDPVLARPPVTVTIGPAIKTVSAGSLYVILQVTLTATEPAQARVKLFANPERGSPLDGGLVIEQILTVNGSVSIPVKIPVRSAGDFEVEVIAEKAEGSVSGGATAYVRISNAGEGALLAPRDYMKLRGVELRSERNGYGFQSAPGAPKISTVDLKSSSKDSPLFFVGAGTITVKEGKASVTANSNILALNGTITTKFNATSIPMANINVQIWDSDTIMPDKLLGTTTTDENGRYSINVVNDDGPFGGGVDVYLYIGSKEANIGMLQLIPSGDGTYDGFYYAWRSETRNNIASLSEEINFEIVNQPQAASVWAGSYRAAYLTKNAGRTISYVEVRYPGFGAGTYFTPGTGLINIDSENNSPIVAGHEYGHAIMYDAYRTNISEGGVHMFCQSASRGLAWSEGFASYYGLVAGLSNDGSLHWTVGDTGRSLERYDCNLRDITIDEGRVTAALWDLYDTHNDSNEGNANFGAAGLGDNNTPTPVVFSMLLGNLWKSVQPNVNQYWTDLKPTLAPNQVSPAVEIMKFNYSTAPN